MATTALPMLKPMPDKAPTSSSGSAKGADRECRKRSSKRHSHRPKAIRTTSPASSGTSTLALTRPAEDRVAHGIQGADQPDRDQDQADRVEAADRGIPCFRHHLHGPDQRQHAHRRTDEVGCPPVHAGQVAARHAQQHDRQGPQRQPFRDGARRARRARARSREAARRRARTEAANPTPDRTRPRMKTVELGARAVSTPPARVTSSPAIMTFLRPSLSPRLPVARMVAAMQSVPMLAASERSLPVMCRALPAATTAMLWIAGSRISRAGTRRPAPAGPILPSLRRARYRSWAFLSLQHRRDRRVDRGSDAREQRFQTRRIQLARRTDARRWCCGLAASHQRRPIPATSGARRVAARTCGMAPRSTSRCLWRGPRPAEAQRWSRATRHHRAVAPCCRSTWRTSGHDRGRTAPGGQPWPPPASSSRANRPTADAVRSRAPGTSASIQRLASPQASPSSRSVLQSTMTSAAASCSRTRSPT